MKHLLVGLSLLLAVGLHGQEPTDFALKAIPDLPGDLEVPEVALGSSYTVRVRLSSAVPGLEAWAFGLCLDTTRQALKSVDDGEDLGRVFFGNPPEYKVIREWTEAGAATGVTQAVVLAVRGGASLGAIPEDEAISVLRLELEPAPETAESEVTMSFCDTLGAPPVETLCIVGNSSIAPEVQEGATVRVVRDPPTLIAFEEDTYNLAISVGSLAATTRVRSTMDLYGFSFGVAHDPRYLRLRPENPVTLSDDLTTVLGGSEPEFWAASVVGDAGYTVGVVFQASQPEPGSDLLSIKSDQDSPSTSVFTAVYVPGPEAADGVTTELSITDQLGTPPVAVLFDVGEEFVPNTRDAGVIISGEPLEAAFIRGDFNGDGRYVISDAVFFLRYFFAGRPLGYDCPEATDANNDSRVNVADAVYLLSYLFVNGPEPPAPFAACGQPSPDDPEFLGCLSFPACGP
jgi:hypothetical protein